VPRHDPDAILDATARIVLEHGARAASIAAIARAAGAPTGSLYHRFGSRDGILATLWLRTVRRFLTGILAAAAQEDPVEAGVAMAAATVDFVRDHPADARLLLSLRRQDLLDGGPPEDLDAVNEPARRAVTELARRLGLPRERVAMAVVDLPYGAVRRHLTRGGPPPRTLRRDVSAAARVLLTKEPS
jgi:AcrR family transcriptional regulator